MALAAQGAHASTAYGDLNNFDTVNDCGVETHGFEIEIDGARSTDITYTYDWNHYGPPKITEDISNPANPKVFIRYESGKDSSGNWTAYTAVPLVPIGPTGGHACTDPSVNQGCEHFGVGYYGAPTAISYNWLIDSGGTLAHYNSPVMVATPNFTYVPPAPAQPAVVVAVIPAPVVPVPAAMQFGEPSFVKVIKTSAHNANNVALDQLVSDDKNGDGILDWQNGEPAQVETEFKLLQTNTGGNPAKQELQGLGDDVGDGSEIVTRRYEFYKYGAAADTRDGENGEAMCDEVNPTTDPNNPLYLHGVGTSVAVTDSNGITQYVNCEAQVVVGDYIGAQMAGFDAAMPLGLIDNLQDGDKNVPYTPRSLIVGGNTPYFMQLTAGSLPPGMSLGTYTDPQSGDVSQGVLFGTPTLAGTYNFTVDASDVDNVVVNKAYTLKVMGDVVVTPQHWLVVSKFNSGSGNVSGNGIDCGATCAIQLDEGTVATLTATPANGSRFAGWSSDCAGSGSCVVTMSTDKGVGADFIQQYALSVAKTGGGSGTVSGNGINCGATCAAILDSGTAVSLAAAAASGSVFTGWSGDCSGTGTCNTTMSVAHSVSASFVPATTQVTLTVTHTGSGVVTSAPKGINCGKQCSHAFAVGSSVTLTAKPAKKHLFLGWSGACSGTALTCTVTMLGNKSVAATFN
jgi:hypothetical protein